MKIFALTILYNTKPNRSHIKRITDNNFIPCFFDNSNDKQILLENSKYCSSNNIIYDSFNSNIGLPKAYNLVINKYLKEEDWVVIFDQDTEVPNNYFTILKAAIQSKRSLVYLTNFKLQRKNHYTPKEIIDISNFKMHPNTDGKPKKGFLCGINSCTAFSFEIFNRVGLFCEDLFLDYVDDEMFFRIAYNNIKIESINIILKQNFFLGEKQKYKNIKRRIQNIKLDGKVFFSQTYFPKNKQKILWHFNNFLYCLKFAYKNNFLFLIPLLLCRPKCISANKKSSY